jgi:hypothetical protein
MTVQPFDDVGEDDPVEILRALPTRYHGQFLADYDAAVAGARRPEQYRRLRYVLRLWRLRAAAYSDPEFDARLEATGSGNSTPIEKIVPDWDIRLAEARQRRGQK